MRVLSGLLLLFRALLTQLQLLGQFTVANRAWLRKM